MDLSIPEPGQWPVDPQEDERVLDSRIWIDGCFDFFHHGHAGVMLQARQLGTELYVGIHSDEEILEHKGPTVMSLKERISAASACRWSTKIIPSSPYVTSLPWLTHYGCRYVVHGDDITSDSSGEDCYRHAKRAGRFKVVKRTPGISTTDLVGRMLLCTKTHFLPSLGAALAGVGGGGDEEERSGEAAVMRERVRSYASDETGAAPGVDVWEVDPSTASTGKPAFAHLVPGKTPLPGQRTVYVDGGFDLFSSGHIEFLRSVVSLERVRAEAKGWYGEEAKAGRMAETGADYGPVYVVAGVHDDGVINEHKGLNYPVMNVFERGLCLLQCEYINATIFSAPFSPTTPYLLALPTGAPSTVYHGPTSFMPLGYDPYVDAKAMGLFEEVPRHEFQEVDAGQIVGRIMRGREAFEERQRRKGGKGVVERGLERAEGGAV